jgi:hypothetical protein
MPSYLKDEGTGMNKMSLDQAVEGSRVAWERARRDGANRVKLAGQGLADAMREAATTRDAAIEPILQQLPTLSPGKVATELERRGFGQVSHKTIVRARQRLGLPNWRLAAQAARKANRELAVE